MTAAASLASAPAQADQVTPNAQPTQQVVEVQNTFDALFGTQMRGPRTYSTVLGQQLAAVAEASDGRIGVAAVDLATGHAVDVLGDQRFPMASTSKVAIAATFLEGVDQGKWSLTSEFPLMIPVRSAPFSSAVAPVRPGTYMTAGRLMELMLTRSNNYATDALLKVVGGPAAVNEWVRRAGIEDWHIDRDIATLVRDDGAIDPAAVIDKRDSATPLAMVRLLTGIYQGKWLSPSSRKILLDTMGRCVTGKRRIVAGLPETVQVLHKTGSLHNTSSDIGIIETPDGRVFAVAIYVTGQGSRPGREARIASIARTIYNGYLAEGPGYHHTASR
ncbi:class A beta-lactamase [Novosphingobium mangrovi (ex Huang et al. 2023)]|uniref:Beta-lactamase n=1 Tax=Novosphingobium mangrovi (ex Huang et al. 2023) TaxID=2976432 RepID=A0ABT2I2R8_9SPHN|nr:class A beta-lactamase [Novosphingobium mangrovi (ex Huang et al. 2023)]MCT2399094.1 class A beta-lactamase [Novosphingobium mangrovi (ex Huang et al. 2023)]